MTDKNTLLIMIFEIERLIVKKLIINDFVFIKSKVSLKEVVLLPILF